VDSVEAVSELKEDSLVVVDYPLEAMESEEYLLEELTTSTELEELEESEESEDKVPQSIPVVQSVPKNSHPQSMPKKLEVINPSPPNHDPNMFEHFRVLWMDTLFDKSIQLGKKIFSISVCEFVNILYIIIFM